MYSKFGEAEQIPNQALADYDECGQFLALIKPSPKDYWEFLVGNLTRFARQNDETDVRPISYELTVGCLSWDRGTLQ